MLNLKSYSKVYHRGIFEVISSGTLIKPERRSYVIRSFSLKHVSVGDKKSQRNEILAVSRNKKNKEKLANSKISEEKTEPSMKDYLDKSWSWYRSNNRDEYALVKQIQVLQKYSNRYNVAAGQFGSETNGKAKFSGKTDDKENRIKISINKPIVKEFSTYKGIDTKKSYSKSYKFKTEDKEKRIEVPINKPIVKKFSTYKGIDSKKSYSKSYKFKTDDKEKRIEIPINKPIVKEFSTYKGIDSKKSYSKSYKFKTDDKEKKIEIPTNKPIVKEFSTYKGIDSKKSYKFKTDDKEKGIEIPINKPIVKEFSTYKGIDAKKSYCNNYKFKTDYTENRIAISRNKLIGKDFSTCKGIDTKKCYSKSCELKAGQKENIIKIPTNNSVNKALTTKEIDAKKSFSNCCAFKEGYRYITLDDEPEEKVKSLVEPEPPKKKPILLYSLGLKNIDTATAINGSKVVKKTVDNNSIQEPTKTLLNRGAKETVLSYKYKEPADRKPRIYPKYYKQVDKLLTRSYTTNNTYVEQPKTCLLNINCTFSAPFSKKVGRAKSKKEKLPGINELTMTDIYNEKYDVRKRQACKRALKCTQNSPDVIKILDNSLKEVRKVHGDKLNDEEIKLTPSVYSKTSLLVKKSHLPIQKCKNMTENSHKYNQDAKFTTVGPDSEPSLQPVENKQDSASVKIDKQVINPDRSDKQIIKKNIVQRIMSYFNKKIS